MTDTSGVNAEVEGYFRLEDGTMLRRTVHERLTVESDQTKQRALGAWLERLQTAGHEFTEGHGILTQVLAQRILR